MTDSEKGRGDFEKWLLAHQRDKGFGIRLEDWEFTKILEDGRYRSSLFEHMWETWQHLYPTIESQQSALAALREENARLREALKRIAEWDDSYRITPQEMQEIANQALATKEADK